MALFKEKRNIVQDPRFLAEKKSSVGTVAHGRFFKNAYLNVDRALCFDLEKWEDCGDETK